MQNEYRQRLNRVVDYIDAHLEEELSLSRLAEEANFSPYHFHRIFSSLMGETLGAYIQRLRLERAAGYLGGDQNRTVTEIGMDLGFSSPAVFSRAFKEYFGMSPSLWRDGGYVEHSKNCKLQSNRYQALSSYRQATRVESSYTQLKNHEWRISMQTETNQLEYTVKIEELPERTVAYVRHTGPYAGNEGLFEELFGKLMRWAGARDLFDPEKSEMITIYHDSPEITEEDKLRISVCLTVPPETEVSGEVGKMLIPAGRYARAEFLLTPETYGDAWNSLFAGWLPESGYQCAEGPCYETYLNDPHEHPEGKHHVAICLPVKPL